MILSLLARIKSRDTDLFAGAVSYEHSPVIDVWSPTSFLE